MPQIMPELLTLKGILAGLPIKWGWRIEREHSVTRNWRPYRRPNGGRTHFDPHQFVEGEIELALCKKLSKTSNFRLALVIDPIDVAYFYIDLESVTKLPDMGLVASGGTESPAPR